MASNTSDVTCPSCGHRGTVWGSYFCDGCGDHHDQLYREEHHDVERARTMNRPDIIAEYRNAGIPFSPNSVNAWMAL